MRTFRRRHADQHLRAENEETGSEETGRLHDIAGERHQPQRTNGEQNSGGKNQVHWTAVAVKQLVRAPPRHQRTDKSPQFEHGHGGIGSHQIHAERLRHVQIAPVINRCTDHVHQHITQ